MKNTKCLSALTALVLLPAFAFAQDDYTGEVHSFQSVLDQLYDDMIPLCSELIGVGQGIAGFASLFYIGYRVWRNIANAEPIDVYPLLRPFAIGLAIMMFPSVIAVMNGVLEPTVSGTAMMMRDSEKSIAYLLKKQEETVMKSGAFQPNPQNDQSNPYWYQYANPDEEEETGMMPLISIRLALAKATFALKSAIKQIVADILHMLYEAAALCINTIRTFYLIVLAILGPIVFGLSIFDAFQHTLVSWFARYINVYLWLPVANIFGAIISKIQENMLKIDIDFIAQYGDTMFGPSDLAYILFLIIGVIGYFTVPSVAGYIISPGGPHTLLTKTTNVFGTAASAAVGGAAGGAAGAASTLYPNPKI